MNADLITALGSVNEWNTPAALVFCIIVVLYMLYANRKDAKERENRLMNILDKLESAIDRLVIKVEILTDRKER